MRVRSPNVNTSYRIGISQGLYGKVAGGSSNKFYNYNQLAKPLIKTNYYYELNSGSTPSRTYDESNNSSTYTARGTNNSFRLLTTDANQITVYENHVYYVSAKFNWSLANATITNIKSLQVYEPWTPIAYKWPIENGKYAYSIYKCGGTTTGGWVMSPNIDSGTVQDGDTFTISNIMIIDLTELFGEGNEPSTIEEVKSILTKDYYPPQENSVKLTIKQINRLGIDDN